MIYIALGDSISIDEYPRAETGRSGLGAASLFHRNADDFWPEFRGQDLVTRYGGVRFTNLTADGATSDDVLSDQMPRVKGSTEPAIVTITAGGNDLLMNLGAPRVPLRFVEDIVDRVRRIVDQVRRAFPQAQILLGSIYDPSDGTNVLDGERLDREAGWLAAVNEGIRRTPGVTIIDIHRHFLGHGTTAPPDERWYWSGLIFEPNARGASEVRRLWLEASGARATSPAK